MKEKKKIKVGFADDEPFELRDVEGKVTLLVPNDQTSIPIQDQKDRAYG
jgi:hypothetical protein